MIIKIREKLMMYKKCYFLIIKLSSANVFRSVCCHLCLARSLFHPESMPKELELVCGPLQKLHTMWCPSLSVFSLHRTPAADLGSWRNRLLVDGASSPCLGLSADSVYPASSLSWHSFLTIDSISVLTRRLRDPKDAHIDAMYIYT